MAYLGGNVGKQQLDAPIHGPVAENKFKGDVIARRDQWQDCSLQDFSRHD